MVELYLAELALYMVLEV